MHFQSYLRVRHLFIHIAVSKAAISHGMSEIDSQIRASVLRHGSFYILLPLQKCPSPSSPRVKVAKNARHSQRQRLYSHHSTHQLFQKEKNFVASLKSQKWWNRGMQRWYFQSERRFLKTPLKGNCKRSHNHTHTHKTKTQNCCPHTHNWFADSRQQYLECHGFFIEF